MKILLIKTSAEAHVYSHFLAALRDAFRELGHEAHISDQSVHVSEKVAPVHFLARELERGRYEAALSFSSFFGSARMNDGRSLFDALGVKFVGWQLDHPIYAPQSLTRPLQGRFAVYSNPNHLRFAQAVKVPGRALTMPPGGALAEIPLRDHAARRWQVFVAATCRGEPPHPWDQMPDSPAKSLLTGVIDHLLADREASLLDAFNDTAAKQRLNAKLGRDPLFDDQMIAFLREPLTYVRNQDRLAIVRALVDSGLPVTICGSGWQALLGEPKNVTFVPPVAFKDLPALYGDARVVININAGNGASERVIYGSLAGAAVVSDFSQTLDAMFGDGITFFNRAKPETVAATVADLVCGAKSEIIAARAYETTVRSGLWRHRAEQLIAFLQTA